MNPVLHEFGSKALDQLSTKIQPNKRYKTDRKDHDKGSAAQINYYDWYLVSMHSPQRVNNPTNPLYQRGDGIIVKI